MARKNKQYASGTAAGTVTNPQNTPGGGRLPISGAVTIQLGRKGVSISGNGIESMTVPIRAKQQSQQQQHGGGGAPFQGNWQGGGGQGVNVAPILQNCILAATQQLQIGQQMFSLHQQSQATNQQLLSALTQFAGQAGMSTGKGKKFRNVQSQYQNQQTQSRKQRRAQNQQYAMAGS